jgi:hypothetical protein
MRNRSDCVDYNYGYEDAYDYEYDRAYDNEYNNAYDNAYDHAFDYDCRRYYTKCHRCNESCIHRELIRRYGVIRHHELIHHIALCRRNKLYC